jgi:hypothetical protein
MTLYHIGYVNIGKILMFLGTNGVTSGYKLSWWLTSTAIWPILGFTGWFPNIDTLGNVIVMVGIIGWWTFITSSLNNCLNLSLTKGPPLN